MKESETKWKRATFPQWTLFPTTKPPSARWNMAFFFWEAFFTSVEACGLVLNCSCSHMAHTPFIHSFIHSFIQTAFMYRLKFFLPEIQTEYYLNVDILLVVALRTRIRLLLSMWWLTMIKATMWLPYFLWNGRKTKRKCILSFNSNICCLISKSLARARQRLQILNSKTTPGADKPFQRKI